MGLEQIAPWQKGKVGVVGRLAVTSNAVERVAEEPTTIQVNDYVNSLSMSPDGTLIASALSGNGIKIWNAANGELVKTLQGHTESVHSVVWSPGGTRIASGSIDKTVKVWNATTGALINTLQGHAQPVESVAWSPDGTQIASGSRDNNIKIWIAATGELVNTLEHHTDWVMSVAWSPDGTRIASGSWDETINIWSAANGELLETLEGHAHQVYSVAWSPDNTKIASGSWDMDVKIWNADTGAVTNTLGNHVESVSSVVWSPDGTQIASGSDDNTIKIWKADTGELIDTLEGHANAVSSVVWSSDGMQIVTGSADKTIKIWTLSRSRAIVDVQVQTLESSRQVVQVAWNQTGTLVASAAKTAIKIWNAGIGQVLHTFRLNNTMRITSVSWRQDNRYIACGTIDGDLYVFDAFTMLIAGELIIGRMILSVAWNLDGTKIVIRGSRIFTVDFRNTTLRFDRYLDESGEARAVAWNPRGTEIAAAFPGGIVRIWGMDSGQPRKTFRVSNHNLTSIDWDPTGTKIVVGSGNGTIYIFHVEDDQTLKRVRLHDRPVVSVVWSPDGTLIATGSVDQTIKIVYATSTQVLRTLQSHAGTVWSVQWSPDGTRLASGSNDRTTKIWTFVYGDAGAQSDQAAPDVLQPPVPRPFIPRTMTFRSGTRRVQWIDESQLFVKNLEKSLIVTTGGQVLDNVPAWTETAFSAKAYVKSERTGMQTTMRVYARSSDALLQTIVLNAPRILHVVLFEDEYLAAVLGLQGIVVYDIATGEQVAARPRQPATALAWPRRDWLFFAHDKVLGRWDPFTLGRPIQSEPLSGNIRTIAATSTGSHVLVGVGSRATLFDGASLVSVGPDKNWGDIVLALAWHPSDTGYAIVRTNTAQLDECIQYPLDGPLPQSSEPPRIQDPNAEDPVPRAPFAPVDPDVLSTLRALAESNDIPALVNVVRTIYNDRPLDSDSPGLLDQVPDDEYLNFVNQYLGEAVTPATRAAFEETMRNIIAFYNYLRGVCTSLDDQIGTDLQTLDNSQVLRLQIVPKGGRSSDKLTCINRAYFANPSVYYTRVRDYVGVDLPFRLFVPKDDISTFLDPSVLYLVLDYHKTIDNPTPAPPYTDVPASIDVYDVRALRGEELETYFYQTPDSMFVLRDNLSAFAENPAPVGLDQLLRLAPLSSYFEVQNLRALTKGIEDLLLSEDLAVPTQRIISRAFSREVNALALRTLARQFIANTSNMQVDAPRAYTALLKHMLPAQDELRQAPPMYTLTILRNVEPQDREQFVQVFAPRSRNRLVPYKQLSNVDWFLINKIIVEYSEFPSMVNLIETLVPRTNRPTEYYRLLRDVRRYAPPDLANTIIDSVTTLYIQRLFSQPDPPTQVAYAKDYIFPLFQQDLLSRSDRRALTRPNQPRLYPETRAALTAYLQTRPHLGA